MPLPTIVQGRSVRVFASDGFDPTTQIIELPFEANQDPVTLSWVSSRRFVGLRDTIVAFAIATTGIGSIYPHKDSDVYYELRKTYQGVDPVNPRTPDQEIVTHWRLQPSRMTKPLWHAPAVNRAMLRIFNDDPGIRNRFRTDFESLVRGDYESKTVTPLSPKGATWKLSIDEVLRQYNIKDAKDVTLFKQLLGSYGLGSEAIPIPEMVLTRIDTCPSNASSTKAGPNFDFFSGIISTQALLRIEASMVKLIKSQISGSSRIKAGYWFVEAPSFETIDANRVRVERHYTFTDAFDPFIYGDPVLT
jgi:hypothetical protein